MNRIKELRQENKLSQIELANKVHASNQAISAYESGTREPKEPMWQKLADFFNVPVAYLKGAYSKKEILAILQETYKKATYQEVGGYDLVKDDIGFNVDLIMIAKGEIEPNEPQLKGMLSPNEVNDFELLTSLGLFNAELMNQAVFQFRRYEDSSLSYTGINKHAGEVVGGWDTTISYADMKMV